MTTSIAEAAHVHAADISQMLPPSSDLGLDWVKGSTDIWRIPEGATIPGQELKDFQPDNGTSRETTAQTHTNGYRPPWLDQEFLPRQEGQWPAYPWCTVGEVLVDSSAGLKRANGVLVGPNLMLTNEDIMPWGAMNWSVEFIAAHRRGGGNPRPFASSFVERIRGYHREGGATGHAYVVCKLYQPLGQTLGWMGTQSLGDMDLEAVVHASAGWSGEPLWFLAGNRPWVAGDHGLVKLVKYGLDNWRP